MRSYVAQLMRDKLRGGVKKVVLLGGWDHWGRGGFEARPQLSAKKVQVFFLLSFDSEHFKTCKYTKKIFFWVSPPPPPNQPNPCVLVAYLDTLIVFVIGARDGRSLGRYFRRIQKKVSWLHSASNLLLFQGFGQSEYSIAYILSP